jgi:hypothetical protein
VTAAALHCTECRGQNNKKGKEKIDKRGEKIDKRGKNRQKSKKIDSQ